MDTLVLVMLNDKPEDAAIAANSVLDRAWGDLRDKSAARSISLASGT
jgi:hypothetical protein